MFLSCFPTTEVKSLFCSNIKLLLSGWLQTLSAIVVANVGNDDYAEPALEDAITAAGNSELLAQEEELLASIAVMLE